MTPAIKQRYSNIAIGLHWLMALLLIGMLVFGKIMTSMDDASPLRYLFTQWHKTTGIMLLFLALLRILWRLGHAAPAHPAHAPAWEKFAASASHFVLYALLFLIPISGWLMVSASELNIDTLLFGVIPFPDVPYIGQLDNRAELTERFHSAHEWLSHGLIAIVLLHIGAAFKHFLIDKDDVMPRMLPSLSDPAFKKLLWGFAGFVVLLTALVQSLNYFNTSSVPLSSGASRVGFYAQVTGENTEAFFTQTDVTASIDLTNFNESSLRAVVDTASVESSNYQVKGSLPEAEWFNTAQFPNATFEATEFSDDGSGNLAITGNLTIKSTTKAVSFPIQLLENEGSRQVSGEFTVNRLDFDLGAQSQPNGDYVGLEVVINFQFELNSPK